MIALSRALILFAALCCATNSAQAQSSTREATDGTASISGRITIGDEPAPGIMVTLIREGDRSASRHPPLAKATTDEDGRFRLTGLTAGRYIVMPLDPLLYLPWEPTMQGKSKWVNVIEGEETEEVNFSFVRGGVITGRVADQRGRPLIGERVTLNHIDERNRKTSILLTNNSMLETDDRGVYRLYGVPPGRYVVSIGEDLDDAIVKFGDRGGFHLRTYHPDATDITRANPIEVSAGGEATGVDITVGRLLKTYTATGRVIYADTGEPVANALYGYGIPYDDGKRIKNAGFQHRTDAQGNFRLEGILPGRYAAVSAVEGESDYYGEPVPFDVTAGDVSGLEIRVHRGANISGVAVIEGTDDPAILARMSQLQFSAFDADGGPNAPRSGNINAGPDGSFRIGALRPGKAQLFLQNHLPIHKGFHLVRVERDGVDVTGGIEIAPGESVSGLRAIIAYGNSRIRGQLKAPEGDLPEGVFYFITAHRIGDSTGNPVSRERADDRGRFVIEGLPAGEYQIVVMAISTASAIGSISSNRTYKHTVTVTDQTEAQVTITIDLKATDKQR